jgi:hypothetical protein
MARPSEQCPACFAPVDDAWCPSCGLELGGEDAEALRDLSSRVAAADAELNVAWARRDELARELATRRLQWVNVATTPVWPPAPNPARPSHSPMVGEWNVERIRNVLLWLGATLLALSALTFTAVAWTHLGPGGRAVLLIALTALAGSGAVASRDRLPATSGALTGLAIALTLVDWQIVRRAGVAPGMSGAAWWSIGTALVGTASLAFGRIAAPKPAQRASVVLVPVAAVLALGTNAAAAWSFALGMSLLAAALLVTDRVLARGRPDPVVRGLVRAEAATAWAAAAVAVTVAAFEPSRFVETLVPAAVMLTLVLAPAVALLRPHANTSDRMPFAILVLVPFLGAAVTVFSTAVGPVGLLTVAVVVASAGLVVAPAVADAWQRALQIVGAAVGTVGAFVAGSAALVATFGPTAWFDAPWSGALTATARDVVSGPHTTTTPMLGWCAVAMLLIGAVTVPLATREEQFRIVSIDAWLWRVVGTATALLALAVVPIAAGAPAYVAYGLAVFETCALILVTARLLRGDAGHAIAFGALALLPMIPAAGWAAMTPTASIVALAVLVVAAGTAAAVGRFALLRAAHAVVAAAAAILLAGVIAAAAGAFAPIAGFAAAAVAGATVLVGAHLRRDTGEGVGLEVTGVAGIVVGAAIAAPSTPWLAATLTLAVPFMVVAGLAHRGVEYGVLATAAALGATWSWLAAAGVTVVEAYTLPAAVAALAAGARAPRDARARSWLTLGPALVLLLGPTLVLALSRNDDGRAIAVGCAAVVTLLAGAHRRLQAPIVLGAATLLALGIDKLGPPAARLPRWTVLALAGSLLLWVGTTFERRRADVQRALRGFDRLG